MKNLIFTALCLAFFNAPLPASACASGAKCLAPPESGSPRFAPGDVLDPGSFNVLLNTQYHGLPRTTDGSWYVTVDRRVLRIDPETFTIIEDVTKQARNTP